MQFLSSIAILRSVCELNHRFLCNIVSVMSVNRLKVRKPAMTIMAGTDGRTCNPLYLNILCKLLELQYAIQRHFTSNFFMVLLLLLFFSNEEQQQTQGLQTSSGNVRYRLQTGRAYPSCSTLQVKTSRYCNMQLETISPAILTGLLSLLFISNEQQPQQQTQSPQASNGNGNGRYKQSTIPPSFSAYYAI